MKPTGARTNRQILLARRPDGRLETVLPLMNLHGRVVCCGVVSQYDTATPAPGPRAVPGLLVVKRLRMEGFIVMGFLDQWPAAEAQLASWVGSGELKVLEDVVEGLESAPAALIGVLAGDNVGKRIVRIAPDPRYVAAVASLGSGPEGVQK